MNEIEFEIIKVLKQGIPLRTREIARVLSVNYREVKHYLCTSLQTQVVQDQKHQWMLKSALQQGEQLSLPFEVAQEQSSLDELLQQNQQQGRKTALEQTLRSLMNFSEE